MNSETGAAVSYLRGDLRVSVPAGSVSRVYVPDDRAKSRFITAVLKAKCEAGEALELFGEAVHALSEPARARVRRRIAVLSPIVGLIANLNVWENISLPAAYHGAPALERVAELAEQVLARFGLQARLFLARLPEELDVLESKIAALVRLLAAEPALAIVDALDAGLGRAERERRPLFEAELLARLPGATLLYVDSREED